MNALMQNSEEAISLPWVMASGIALACLWDSGE